jgi:hypothetical protein
VTEDEEAGKQDAGEKEAEAEAAEDAKAQAPSKSRHPHKGNKPARDKKDKGSKSKPTKAKDTQANAEVKQTPTHNAAEQFELMASLRAEGKAVCFCELNPMRASALVEGTTRQGPVYVAVGTSVQGQSFFFLPLRAVSLLGCISN